MRWWWSEVVQDHLREWLLEEHSFCPTERTMGCLVPGCPEGPEPDSCEQQSWVGLQSWVAYWWLECWEPLPGPELAADSQLSADIECVLSSSWRHWLCTWGRPVYVCVRARSRVCLRCGRGMPGLLGCPRTRQHNFESACVWSPWYPPLVHPSESMLGLCWVLGTCDNLMGSPPSRSLFVLGGSLCFAMGTV